MPWLAGTAAAAAVASPPADDAVAESAAGVAAAGWECREHGFEHVWWFFCSECDGATSVEPFHRFHFVVVCFF